jgi:hypothetical protein
MSGKGSHAALRNRQWLAADLQRHLNNETVTARPPSSIYRFQKLIRRNKLAFAAGAAVTATLVLGVIASTLQAIRATHMPKLVKPASVNKPKPVKRGPSLPKPAKPSCAKKPRPRNSPPAAGPTPPTCFFVNSP